MDRHVQGFGIAINLMLLFNLAIGLFFSATTLLAWTYLFCMMWTPYVSIRIFFMRRKLKDARSNLEYKFEPSMGFHAKL